jgi:hypothetical protein
MRRKSSDSRNARSTAQTSKTMPLPNGGARSCALSLETCREKSTHSALHRPAPLGVRRRPRRVLHAVVSRRRRIAAASSRSVVSQRRLAASSRRVVSQRRRIALSPHLRAKERRALVLLSCARGIARLDCRVGGHPNLRAHVGVRQDRCEVLTIVVEREPLAATQPPHLATRPGLVGGERLLRSERLQRVTVAGQFPPLNPLLLQSSRAQPQKKDR